jgi:hypothetical protein
MKHTKSKLSYALPLLTVVSIATCSPNPDFLRIFGPQGVNLWKLETSKASLGDTTRLSNIAKDRPPSFAQSTNLNNLGLPDAYKPGIPTEFPAQWFIQPLDHFSENNNHTFRQRFWVNDRHYAPGSGTPVIVLDGGETSGEVCKRRVSPGHTVL